MRVGKANARSPDGIGRAAPVVPAHAFLAGVGTEGGNGAPRSSTAGEMS